MNPQESQSNIDIRLHETLETQRSLQAEVLALRQVNEALGGSNQRFRMLASHIDEAFWLSSPDETELYYVSPAYETIVGRSCDSLHADPRSWVESLHPEDRHAVIVEMERRGAGPHQDHRDHEYRVLQPDGSARWVWMRSVPVIDDDGNLAARAGVVQDITERKTAEEELRLAALHDKLTNLPNRSLLIDRLKQAIERSKKETAYKFAVLFLDFDRFKIINDSLGHEVGDMLLVSIAERLTENLRSGDTASLGDGHVAARLGGDEFVILLDGLATSSDATIVAERLQKALSAPHPIGGHDVIATASIGIVTSEGHYDRAEDILRDADTAMYHAKNRGKARHVVFDDRMHEEVVQRLRLEEDLRRAVVQHEFSLDYQPIVALSTGKLVGFEALIRWQHPERGIILPDNFIGLAEEIGLIVPMGTWVLGEAARQLKKWHVKFPTDPPVTMNVNLSKHQLRQGDLVKIVEEVIRDSGVDAQWLKLEITESVIMDSPEHITNVLQQLKNLGVGLCMDDFGTGHSSLSCLHRFPIDVMKIDRTFVLNTDGNRQYAAVIHAIITLAHTLHLIVVGEGVETAGQLAQLQALDCDLAQGNYFAKSMNVEAVEAYLSGPHGLAKSA